ncbi:hypothetical protein [Flavobacterium notoginsengisoli]|uniref:hypothetical protein n=1 Tax=Flavobacterium notoginsengisoli TaxID=1478199 RepID=UPI00363BE974
MKILFICGSIEPGKDGVGDYTRRLCGELIRIGHDVKILSLSDFDTVTFLQEFQETEETKVHVSRIPVAVSNRQRHIWTQEVLNDFEPEWISLQYVPYSFNPKGLPFWLPSFLKKLKGNHRWHVMFHELWLGIDTESSLKHKCIGKVQQLIAKRIIRKIKTNFINTQNKLYQYFLKSRNINAAILPICGNIPLTGEKSRMNDYIQIVLFGTIHPGAPFQDFIDDLGNLKSELHKPIKLIFIGKNGTELYDCIDILENRDIEYEVMGIQSEAIISQVLIDSDFGISTTPYFQTEKSGVFAAYKEHQINAISVSREWTPTKGQYTIPNIIKYEKNNLKLTPMPVQVFDLNSLASQFIKSLSVS